MSQTSTFRRCWRIFDKDTRKPGKKSQSSTRFRAPLTQRCPSHKRGQSCRARERNHPLSCWVRRGIGRGADQAREWPGRRTDKHGSEDREVVTEQSWYGVIAHALYESRGA